MTYEEMMEQVVPYSFNGEIPPTWWDLADDDIKAAIARHMGRLAFAVGKEAEVRNFLACLCRVQTLLLAK